MGEQRPETSIQAERQERQRRIDEQLTRVKRALAKNGFVEIAAIMKGIRKLCQEVEDLRDLVISDPRVGKKYIVEKESGIDTIQSRDSADNHQYIVIANPATALAYIPDRISQSYLTQSEREAFLTETIERIKSERAHLHLLLRTLTDRGDLDFMENIQEDPAMRAYLERRDLENGLEETLGNKNKGDRITKLTIDAEGKLRPPKDDEKDKR